MAEGRFPGASRQLSGEAKRTSLTHGGSDREQGASKGDSHSCASRLRAFPYRRRFQCCPPLPAVNHSGSLVLTTYLQLSIFGLNFF